MTRDRSLRKGEVAGRLNVKPALNPTSTNGRAPSVLFDPPRPMSRAKHSLRIFALPLSKQSAANTTTGTRNARGVLNTYYHFETTSSPEVNQGNPSLISRATDKAASIWTGWGKAAPGTWKVRYSNSSSCLLCTEED